MKLFTDFLPIVIFFVAYKLYGIFTATGAAIVVSVLLVSWAWYKYRKVDNTQWITLGAIVILGGATLIFHKAIYIQWKVSIVYWALALAFLLSQFIGKASLVKRLFGKHMELPTSVWKRLNASWAVFFALMGTINLYVVYHYSTDVWVNFKLFGTLGGTLVFVITQALFIAKYLPRERK